MANAKMAGGTKLEKLKRARTGYQTAKVNFNNQYAALSQYFYQIKVDQQVYTPQVIQGQFENDGNINDNIGSKCARLMASALMGMIWKNERGTFRIIPAKHLENNEASIKYFDRITNDLAMFMERPKSRLTTSLFKTILESVIYGTSGLVVGSGGYANPLKYYNKSILSFYIGYDKEGEITELFIDYNYSAEELWDRYGEAAGSQVAQCIQSNDHLTRFVMTEAIRPRTAAETKNKAGKLGMPYSADRFMPNQNIYLEDGGYESLPLKVLFHDKLEYESYGRGPGMEALPTVVQTNVSTEILEVGGELTAQPALGMFDNGSLAGLAVDLSAGALNVFNVAGTVPTDKPIFPLFEIGDLRVIFELRKEFKGEVAEYFLLDKLYDLQTKQRMTLGEALMREQIRSDALSPIFSQQMSFLVEVLDRSVDITYGMGLLGVPDPSNEADPVVAELRAQGIIPHQIPPKILEAQMGGLDWYEIQFISPAARIMNNEELQSTLKFISVMGEAGALSPEFVDVIDPDGTAEKLKRLTATDSIVTRSMAERKIIRKGRAQMQMEMAKVEAQAKMAAANQANAQAAAARSGAVRNMAEMGGE